MLTAICPKPSEDRQLAGTAGAAIGGIDDLAEQLDIAAANGDVGRHDDLLRRRIMGCADRGVVAGPVGRDRDIHLLADRLVDERLVADDAPDAAVKANQFLS